MEEPVQRGADRRGPAGAGGGWNDGNVCRRHGISGATFYKWKAKFAGMGVSDAKRLKALEDAQGYSRLVKLVDSSSTDPRRSALKAYNLLILPKFWMVEPSGIEPLTS